MELLHFQPPVIAHRGASAYAPENTIAALTKAAQLGVKWVEFDVMLAACQQPVLFHDKQLSRCTNGLGQISDYPYTYLRSLDAGAWFNPRFSGEPIPTLSQALEFLQNAKMSANIEIKSLRGQEKNTTLRIWQEAVPFFSEPNSLLLFSSFSIEVLAALRKQSPACLIGLLMHEWLPDWQMICDDLQCVSVHVNQHIMTIEKAKKLKNTGRALLCYTVNDPFRAKELYSWGVDAVFSDRPDMLQYLL